MTESDMLDCRFRFCVLLVVVDLWGGGALSNMQHAQHAAAQSGAREYLSEGFDVDLVELLAGLDLGQQRSIPTGHTAQQSEEEHERRKT